MDLVDFLRQRIAEDEAWARAANQTYQYAEPAAKAPEGGVHWRWVVGDQWETAKFDPAVDEFVAEPGYPCWLATVEEWPTKIGDRMMPRSYANEIVEMDAAAAGHIARHDPARVLRDVEAKRAILDQYAEVARNERRWDDTYEAAEGYANAYGEVVRQLALRYVDHPDYDEEWWP